MAIRISAAFYSKPIVKQLEAAHRQRYYTSGQYLVLEAVLRLTPAKAACLRATIANIADEASQSIRVAKMAIKLAASAGQLTVRQRGKDGAEYEFQIIDSTELAGLTKAKRLEIDNQNRPL